MDRRFVSITKRNAWGKRHKPTLKSHGASRGRSFFRAESPPRRSAKALIRLLVLLGMAFAVPCGGNAAPDGAAEPSGPAEPVESARPAGPEGYPRITGPCGFTFPADHASHPEHRTEWWYWTGNLEDRQGNRHGFQLTFFRRRLAPPGTDASRPEPASPWRTSQLYLAHAALSDLSAGEHRAAQDIARGAAGLAGAERQGPRKEAVRVFLKDWSALIAPGRHELRARSRGTGDAGEFALHLTLVPEKPPVAHGQDGYSRKGLRPESASCYYSFTRLRAEGSLEMDGRTLDVTGLAWMDHEYSSELLEPDLVGWDWFSLQFEDQTELMAFFLRDRLGGLSLASGGSFVEPDASVIQLSQEDMRLEVLDYWTSPRTGARYPSGWRLDIPELSLGVTIRPAMADQEMLTARTTGVTYWEGSVKAAGTVRGRQAEGRGYVEMTGYAGAMDAPL